MFFWGHVNTHNVVQLQYAKVTKIQRAEESVLQATTMDSDTLHTASTYLNNLLLARGLLRNGKALDFAKPTRDTRAQTINLIHDLLLRRDRDEENREQIALTLRTLRVDQTRTDAEIERLRSRVEEKERNLVQAQTDNRNTKIEMRKLEASAKSLQDQLARLKTAVNHIKTQCANDVRKRDMHLERLKTHLQGQQRGNKGSVVAPLMHTAGGNGSSRGGLAWNASVRDLGDPEYSLKQESNDFLTQLGQSLSDENDGLIAMLRGTLQTMKDLLGLDKDSTNVDDTTSDESSMLAEDIPVSYDLLAGEMTSTLEVLRTVLTSADFVSMEEVEQRDEEIIRLREGWEKMEARWEEVLLMMNAWRTKMESPGGTINLDDLKKGLGLGEGLSEGLDSPKRTRKDEMHERVYSDEDSDINNGRDSGIGHQSPSSPVRPQRSIKGSSKVLEPPELFHQKSAKDRHLRKMSPNVQSTVQSPSKDGQSPRKVAFANVPRSSPLLHNGRGLDTTSETGRPSTIFKSRTERSSPAQQLSSETRSNSKRAQMVSNAME